MERIKNNIVVRNMAASVEQDFDRMFLKKKCVKFTLENNIFR